MPTLEQMAAKGSAKLTRKATQMATSYNASKTRAATNFAQAGFGPTRTAAYQAGIADATYVAPDPARWSANWLAKMRE